MLVVVQVNCAGAAILAAGVVMSCVTVVLALAVQPVVASVIVTLYVPGAVTDFVCDVPPPLHAYVTPVAGDAVKVILVVLQVSCAGVPILAARVVMSCVTVVLAQAVQPVVASVIVTLYVPGVVTDLVCVVPPPLHA